MTATPEQCEPIRRRELTETLPPLNDYFQQYTTSTAFSMSMSRSMIRALVAIEQAILKHVEYNRFPISDSALAAIARRGLIEWIDGTDHPRQFGGDTPRYWADLCRITRPGQLTIELLAEAGLIERAAIRKPLPPPPPGWLDPRPKLVVRENGSWDTLPSDRAAAHREVAT